jgi:hypothetical protein
MFWKGLLTMSAVKHDHKKPKLSLVSYESIAAEARAMEYGMGKYSKNNYKGGMEYSRMLDAAMRHITQYSGGESLDPESGLNHIDHAKACLGMLAYYVANKVGKDDR